MRVLCAAVALALWLQGVCSARPNVLFILVDDQDAVFSPLEYMPKLQKHLVKKGTSYNSHYCTVSLCCPSRVSMWTGRAAHNTNVTDLTGPYGGYPKFIKEGWNEDWFPVWAQREGINVYYAGKLMNSHTRYTYNKPFPKGFAGTRFYITPWVYSYLTPAIQKNEEPPKIYRNQYSGDLITNVTLELIDEAVRADKPFVVITAPVGPHAASDESDLEAPAKEPPVPAKRHRGLFANATIPRTSNFNPAGQSGANWIASLPRLTSDQVDYVDMWHQKRLETMLSVDDMVEDLINDLDRRGILDNTYIIYTSDNGFHLGHHRLPPGKGCGYEEDIKVPYLIRGPGVPEGAVVNFPTTHTDVVPTLLQMLNMNKDHDLDGAVIPYTQSAIEIAKRSPSQQEHVNVEYWSGPNYGGNITYPQLRGVIAGYKGVRIIGDGYSFYYQVWCDNTRELYDMRLDPGQMDNLLQGPGGYIMGRLRTQFITRLDALLLVLKSCKGTTCIRPWQTMMPYADVNSLADALAVRFDFFFARQPKINIERCEPGYIKSSEGPMWETDGYVYRGR